MKKINAWIPTQAGLLAGEYTFRIADDVPRGAVMVFPLRNVHVPDEEAEGMMFFYTMDAVGMPELIAVRLPAN